MTLRTITLSSTSSTTTELLDSLVFEDNTSLIISMDYVYEQISPVYIKIDWGDGVTEIFDKSDSFTVDRTKVNIFKFSTLLAVPYTHEYLPSSTSLYKNLSAQILIEYTNGDVSWFIQPITIRTYDYFESIGDLTLINTNILPVEGNHKQHQLATSVGNYLIELNS